MRQVVICILLAAAGPLHAQDTIYQPGDSVKVKAPSLWGSEREGTIVGVQNDSLTFYDGDADGQLVQIPNSIVTKFQLNRGNRPPAGHFWKGWFLGAIAGSVMGVVAAKSVKPPAPCPPNTQLTCGLSSLNQSFKPFGVALVCMLGGALLGGVLGETVFTTSHYKTMDLSALERIGGLIRESDLAVMPTWDSSQRAPGVALSVRF